MTQAPSARGVTDPERFAGLEAVAVALARGAAQVVRAGRGRELDVRTKSTDTDLVTVVDRDTESWLVAEIGRLRGGDAVLGEESGAHAATRPGAVRWVIDPVDGTVNFVLGIPQYGVSVAAEIDGEVVAGAVCNPATGELFRARAGGGARLERDGRVEVLRGGRDVAVQRAVVGTGFSYDAQRRARQVAVVADVLPRVADLRRLGAASLDLCFVACGRLDGYFEAGLHRWDYAAGALVATEAGCVTTGLRGRAAGDGFVAAASAGTAPGLFALLESLDADRVLDGD